MARIFKYIDGHGKYRELREDNREIEGYHHRVKLDSGGAAALVPNHGYGKQIKHYHPEHPRSNPSDPLYHPKVAVAFKANLNTDGAIPWSERETLQQELDETLINLLSWAGLPTQPTGSVYVDDAYFKADDSARSLRLVEDPTADKEYEQLADALSVLFGDVDGAGGLNQTEREAARALADGGQQDVSALADEIGKSKRTVYRVLDSLADCVTNRNGTVTFASDYLAEQFASLLDGASRAAQLDSESGGSSPWSAFLAKHGPEVTELPGGNIEMDYGHVAPETDMGEILRTGLKAWLRSGREKRRFMHGIARWIQDGESFQEGSKFGKMSLLGVATDNTKSTSGLATKRPTS